MEEQPDANLTPEHHFNSLMAATSEVRTRADHVQAIAEQLTQLSNRLEGVYKQTLVNTVADGVEIPVGADHLITSKHVQLYTVQNEFRKAVENFHDAISSLVTSTNLKDHPQTPKQIYSGAKRLGESVIRASDTEGYQASPGGDDDPAAERAAGRGLVNFDELAAAVDEGNSRAKGRTLMDAWRGGGR